MAKEVITIPLEEYKCLRRCFDEAFKIFKGLGVREQTAPKLSPRKSRELKFKEALSNSGKIKKEQYDIS